MKKSVRDQIFERARALGWGVQSTTLWFELFKVIDGRLRRSRFIYYAGGKVDMVDNAIKHLFVPTNSHFVSNCKQYRLTNSKAHMEAMLLLMGSCPLYSHLKDQKPFIPNAAYKRGPSYAQQCKMLNEMYKKYI